MTLPRRVADLATLELLLDVVSHGSVSRAAAARGISQPSASAAIQRLERELGLRLLDRGPTGSRATREGALVADWAQPLVAAAYALDEDLAGLVGERQRRLHILASYTIAEYLLPSWLAALRRGGAGPDVQVMVHNSSDVMQELLRGDADIGFVEGPDVLRGLEAEEVGGDELVVIVDPRHPWAGRARPLSAQELARTRLVMREHGSGTRDVIEQRLGARASAALPAPLIELGSTTTVKQAVMDGTGPAILSELSVRDELREGRLRRVPVEGVDMRRTFSGVWRASTRRHPAAAELLAICRSQPPRDL